MCLQLALKVCESCGTLWLRQTTESGIYCAACTFHLSRLPVIRTRHAGGRPAQSGAERAPGRGARCNGRSTQQPGKVGGAE